MITDSILHFFKALLEALQQVQKSTQVTPVEEVKQIEVKKVETPVTTEKWRYWDKAHRPVDKHGNKIRLRTKGKYPRDLCGATVHFTAGRSGGLAKAIDSILGAIENNFVFVCIADTGELVQAHPVDEWGSHAGVSAWKEKLFGRIIGSVSDELIGIEINNAGMVTKIGEGKYQTWFKTILTEKDVRHVTEEKYGCPTGYYHKFTPQQEATLIEFLLALKRRDPKTFNLDSVLGHHEVAGKRGIGRWRKNDPGGALSMTMDELRDLLKKRYNEGK